MEELYPFLLSGALGALIGFERAIHHKDMPGSYDVGGIRTFTITSWLGWMAAHMGKSMPGLSLLAFAGFGATILLAYTLHYQERRGITTELAYLGTFGVGFWVGLGEVRLPVLLALGFVTILGLKEPITALTRKLTQEEVYAAIQFLLLAIVVLPLLRAKPLDPWGIIVPRELGLMLVLVSTLGFIGFLVARFSPRESALISALGSGVMSSTAYIFTVVNELRTRKDELQDTAHAPLLLLSSQMMFLKGIFLIAWLKYELMVQLLLPSLLAFLFGVLWVLFAFRRELLSREGSLPSANPLHVSELIRFALILVTLLFLSRLSYRFLGENALYLSSLLSGTLAMDGITVALAHGASYDLPLPVARLALVLAWVGNNLFKILILLFAPAPLRRKTLFPLSAVTLLFLLLSFL